MKAVKVLWVDSCNSNINWTVAEEIEIKPIYIDSFGVVVKDTDEFLAIAQNYSDKPEQYYSNIMTIPKGCIKEVFVIHEDNVCENEQKPAEWNEEDENNILFLTSIIEECFKNKEKITLYGDTVCANFTKENVIDRLKSLRPQRQWKPSEGQLECLGYAIEKAEKDWSPLTNNRIYLTLKALKEQLEKL